MKCTNCGNEMRIVPEVVGTDNSGNPVYHQMAYCDSCKTKTDIDLIGSRVPMKKGESVCGIIGMIFSFIFCNILFPFIGLVLSIIGLCSKTKKSVCGTIGLIVSIFTIILNIFAPQFMKYVDEAKEESQIYEEIQSTSEEYSAESQNEVPLDEAENILDEKFEESKEQAETPEPYEDAISDKEIVFNNISWGTNFPDASEKLSTWDLWNISGEGYKTCSVDDILLGDYKGIDFDYSGINIISHAFNGEQEVAGYTTEDIILYFSYLPVGEYLTYEESDTALYGAQYIFKPVNLQDTYNDLIHKISEIYGEPNKQTQEIDLWENQYTYTYWYGANNTELVLKSLNSENDTTELYDDEIYLTYAWRGGDELLKNASDAVKKEKSDKEKDAQGEGDLSGL